MAQPFTREQLIASLLLEVTKAQAGFQTAQLAAWRQLAPEAALPGHDRLGALNEIELQLRIKPYLAPWPRRLYRWLTGQTAATEYQLALSHDPAAMTLTLRAGRNDNTYRVDAGETREQGE